MKDVLIPHDPTNKKIKVTEVKYKGSTSYRTLGKYNGFFIQFSGSLTFTHKDKNEATIYSKDRKQKMD
jgi:hypothetical protein